jgi:hypothetical protein
MRETPKASFLPHRCVRCRAEGAEWTLYECSRPRCVNLGALVDVVPHTHGTWLCTGCKQATLLPVLGRAEVDGV